MTSIGAFRLPSVREQVISPEENVTQSTPANIGNTSFTNVPRRHRRHR